MFDAKFSKSKLIASKKFTDRSDILSALLADDKEYTIEEAEGIIREYMEGEVK